MTEDVTGSVREIKASLRRKMLAERSAFSSDECMRLSKIICESFIETKEYRDAKTILLYKAYNNEVDTDLIFERAMADGKSVAYPVSTVFAGVPEMTFYEVDDLSKLIEGYKGIKEPDANGRAKPFTKKADICVAPGVVFDRLCHRIGYGKGFYDRYIKQSTPGKVIALAYEIQMADDFDTEENDRTVDMVITDSNIYVK